MLSRPTELPDPDAIKQVLVIRRDLKMRRGKEIAQGAHASLAWLTELVRGGLDPVGHTATMYLDPVALVWVTTGCRKITLQAPDEPTLVALHHAALARGLRSHLIRDAGHTEFGGVPTLTALAIGPNLSARIDEVTGQLALY
jgi:PTH2 family peptidyl-tRNA hydrolase